MGVGRKIRDWFEVRIGLDDFANVQFREFRVPRNVNVFHTLGLVTVVAYMIQVITGILLLVYYVPHPDFAFKSVQEIMNTVSFGWLLRQMHVVGSSLMVIVVFLHMASVFFMGGYRKPREMTWAVGGLMFLITLVFCLSGYLLPWTQLSYWATTVVTSIPTAFPFIGDFISRVLRGGEYVTGITLGRFFALHVSILPLIFLFLMVLHIFFVKRTGLSTPPFGVSSGQQNPWTAYRRETHPDGYPFYPYFVRKEIFMGMLYLTVMFFFITFFPTLFLPEEANTPADPLRTPSQIRPEWYFLAPYQMLKLIPNKFIGITLQILLVAVFLLWPFLDTKKEPNILKRPVLKTVFFLALIILAVLTIWGNYR